MRPVSLAPGVMSALEDRYRLSVVRVTMPLMDLTPVLYVNLVLSAPWMDCLIQMNAPLAVTLPFRERLPAHNAPVEITAMRQQKYSVMKAFTVMRAQLHVYSVLEDPRAPVAPFHPNVQTVSMQTMEAMSAIHVTSDFTAR